MANYRVGLSKLEIGVFNNTTGALPTLWTELAVLKDSMSITTEKATANKFFQSGKVEPVKILYTNGADMAKCSILDTSPEMIQMLTGGSVVTVNNKTTWTKSIGHVAEKVYVMRATDLEGSETIFYRGSLLGTLNFQMTENNIAVIELEITATNTGIANVPAVTISVPN